jgi:hypothetical protein
MKRGFILGIGSSFFVVSMLAGFGIASTFRTGGFLAGRMLLMLMLIVAVLMLLQLGIAIIRAAKSVAVGRFRVDAVFGWFAGFVFINATIVVVSFALGRLLQI